MKNSPTGQQDRVAPSAPWREALSLFEADLRRRGMAEKTRRAYGVDVGQFALWCTAQGVDPVAVGPKDLRRYAAALSARDAVAATVARKLASLRAFYRTLREHGQLAQNPADLIPSPKRPRTLPKVLRPDELATLLARIPASTPLELRDRALFEVAYGCGLHVEESDLISYGLVGLINAIERFEPEREIKFETYAITRIKGAIIDELRSLDWVPRSVRARAREIEKA